MDDVKFIKSILKTQNEVDPYQFYNDIDMIVLAKEINLLLHDENEIKEMNNNEFYKINLINAAQFLYTKYLSERTTMSSSIEKIKDSRNLLTHSSLQTLYGFAI